MNRRRNLKIYEQILIVIILATILPLSVAGFMIANVNQHAVRDQLKYSAVLTAESALGKISNEISETEFFMRNLMRSIIYLNSSSLREKFIKDTVKTLPETGRIEFKKNFMPKISYKKIYATSDFSIYQDLNNKKIIYALKSANNNSLILQTGFETFGKNIFKYLESEKRQIYLIDKEKNIIISHNPDEKFFGRVIKEMPQLKKKQGFVIFGPKKNRPNVVMKAGDLKWQIIVVTPKYISRAGISKPRMKILYILGLSALIMILTALWYTFSLKTSIRQLFKGIIAISKGNYNRKIRLLKNILTPYEVVFLADEFNNMAEKVSTTHEELQKANKKLAETDKFKSDLIDTVSHEFRTPLTCIKGYVSSLIKNRDNIDDETRHKSLKVVKNEADKLNRLVEDLLVIPDIESSLLRIYPDETDVSEVIAKSLNHFADRSDKILITDIEENLPKVTADADRLEQVIINLIENARKYSSENAQIIISAYKNDSSAVIKITNPCEPIEQGDLNFLFEKFTRLERDSSKAVKGTGLGLYISKNLIEAMGGEISLKCSNNSFEVVIFLPFVM